jgi:hypothetical protein
VSRWWEKMSCGRCATRPTPYAYVSHWGGVFLRCEKHRDKAPAGEVSECVRYEEVEETITAMEVRQRLRELSQR